VLVALWLLAWGEISVANLLSGVAVAGALLVAFPAGRQAEVRVSIPGAARLAGHTLVQLVTSNVLITREIVRRRPNLRQGVLAHRLETPSEEVVTVMTSVIALSPGTMTVDVDPDSSTIHVHFLLLRDVDEARASLARLERLTLDAIPATSTSTSKERP
jgi:multicomponent Na+:H+ antiporter subunit E